MTAPTHRPLESYGKELLQVLLRASKERVTLPIGREKGGFAAATTIRQRLYSLRTSMRKYNHEHYNLVAGLKARIEWDDTTPLEKVGRNMVPKDRKTPVRIIIEQQDLAVTEIVQAAGIRDPLVDPTTAPTPSSPVTEVVEHDDLLDKILEGRLP